MEESRRMLHKWNSDDPVDQKEKDRHAKVATEMGWNNPYVTNRDTASCEGNLKSLQVRTGGFSSSSAFPVKACDEVDLEFKLRDDFCSSEAFHICTDDLGEENCSERRYGHPLSAEKFKDLASRPMNSTPYMKMTHYQCHLPPEERD